MTAVRPPAVAGRFYPARANDLLAFLDAVLPEPTPDTPDPKALIVPHAGYVYSGAIAATAYARLLRRREQVRHVVLVGPAHFARLDGLAVSGADAFATPLGMVEVDDRLRARVLELPQVSLDDRAHAPEHSLEVQLPFLQRVLERFTILPLVAGEATPGEVAQVLDRVWGGPETVIIISSDLSHYHDHATATALDQRTAAAIVAGASADIGPDDACGAGAVRGILEAARRHGLTTQLLDLRNSGDTSGSLDEVVGYGAFALA